MISLKKKGAEESNVIIFIILALVVAGLVIYFSWNFFSTGTRLIDGNDPSITVAIESCKFEIAQQPDAYCNSAKYVKIKGGGEMIVSCYFLDTKVRTGALSEVSGKPTCSDANIAFKTTQCDLIQSSGTDTNTLKKTIVDGDTCDTILGLTAQVVVDNSTNSSQ